MSEKPNEWGLKDVETFAEALKIVDGPAPEVERPCKHIFQGRCQLRNVVADAECRCSRRG